mmetsp:Transcript_75974/g.234500  ORF Transcript_75974/g.234500 Transcript_75974/m.234500 type:complete len:207 (-) Transcript_75974:37-657(-)
MIKGVADAELELEVIEREGRFIAGLEWHLQDLLRQLESEERSLTASLLASSQLLPLQCQTSEGCHSLPPQAEAHSTSQPAVSSEAPPPGSRSPRTPPLHALLALDPLCASSMPPLRLDGRHPDEDGKRKTSLPELELGAIPGAPPCKLSRVEVCPGKKVPSEDSTTEGASDCDCFTSPVASPLNGEAPCRWHYESSSSSDTLAGSP